MTYVLLVICFVLSILCMWTGIFIVALIVPHGIGYALNSHRKDQPNQAYNAKKQLILFFLFLVCWGSSLGFNKIISLTDMPIEDDGMLITLIGASIGRLPYFLTDLFTSWYAVVTLILSVTLSIWIYSFIGFNFHLLKKSIGVKTLFYVAGGFAAVSAFVLRLWLPERPGISLVAPSKVNGLYIPWSSCILVFAYGVLAASIIARYKFISEIRNWWICQVFCGLIGIVLGILYNFQIESIAFVTEMEDSVFLFIVKFFSPTMAAILILAYIRFFIKQHKNGYTFLL